MKTIKILVLPFALTLVTMCLCLLVNAQTTDDESSKFEVSIIKADNPGNDKFGVSITKFQERYQYTFEWVVDGKPAGNLPYLHALDGETIQLTITRYPGGDQVTSNYRFEDFKCDLPLYPQRAGHKGELAGM